MNWSGSCTKNRLAVCLLAATLTAAHAVPKDSRVAYNRDVRPILSENCFPCHGTDSAARKASLRLDYFESATNKLDDGCFAIVPGKPARSEMIRRIFAAEDDQMPPEKTHKTLKPEEKELLKKWISRGAPYEPHWAFIAPVKAPLPAVKNQKWARNPVDAFVLARLESERLKPNPEADRRTLIRRLSLDLTGLPPAPDEVEAFVNDKSSGAYEKVVDRLMASPAWGEQRAHYWLDAARYGDTHGIHFDNYREMWLYRDWVITAFNQNLPFDQFTIKQLAGDLLPDATRDDKIASGFNRCNVTSNEGGAIDDEYLALYARDRTETTGQTWLGLTVGCAVCHDHKYDPFSQKDFYAMSAFFNNTTQKAMDGNVKDTPPVLVLPKKEDEKRWLELPGDEAANASEIARLKESGHGEFSNWLAHAGFSALTNPPADALVFHAPLDDGGTNGAKFFVNGTEGTFALGTNTIWQSGAVSAQAFTTGKSPVPSFTNVGDFARDEAFSYSAWVKLDKEMSGSVFARMDDKNGNYRGWDLWLEGGKPAIHILHNWPDDAIKVIAKKELAKGKWSHVCVTYNGSSKAGGVKIYVNGELQEVTVDRDSLSQSVRTTAPFKIGQRETGSPVADVGLQDLRIYARELSRDEAENLFLAPRLKWLETKYHGTLINTGLQPGDSQPDQVSSAASAASQSGEKPLKRLPLSAQDSTGLKPGVNENPLADNKNSKIKKLPQLKPDEYEELFGLWLNRMDASYRQALELKGQLAKEEKEIRMRSTTTFIMQERTNAPEAYVLFRGQYDQRRDRVTPATPSALPPMSADEPRNRLGFAEWLTRPDNPLTARVAVNHFWQELFGTGLVKTTGDFGVAGELPSHPKLLDWLAVEFRESGWDVKHIYRLIVMSATYRQSAVATPEKLEKDPQNRLLARGPRFRMDAEMIRDTALASSGLLVEKIGGPSVKPYQPSHIWDTVGMPEGDTRNYVQDHGDNLYRRSVYTFWKRQAAPASLEIFNAPSRETCTVKRDRTDTPLQALVTLNDPQFIEAARHLAQLTLETKTNNVNAQMDFIAERLLARPLRKEERKVVESSLGDLLNHYRESERDAADLLRVGESKPNAKLDAPTLAAYTMVANEMMNLDETLNK